jgi:glycosyltransferase involved in cell wall biosynthesis
MALTVSVAIATRRRKAHLETLLACIAGQTRLPDQVILAPTDADADLPAQYPPAIAHRLSLCPPTEGLTKQRNACFAATTGDIILFFDDDFLPERGYIEQMTLLFADESVVGATGGAIKDKAELAGFDPNEVQRFFDSMRWQRPEIAETRVVYGCNMAFRMATIRRHSLSFDEGLPLYGWLEDVDFGARIGRFGKLVRSNACMGIHFMSAAGRQSGVMHGYSQIANVRRLYRKRVVTLRYALALAIRNVSGNLVRAWSPERNIDRRGRLRGNALAVADLVRGRLAPERICEL